MGNADRHLCKTCIYKPSPEDKKKLQMHCDYIEIAGEMRKCPVEDCNKYVKGRRTNRRKHLRMGRGGITGQADTKATQVE